MTPNEDTEYTSSVHLILYRLDQLEKTNHYDLELVLNSITELREDLKTLDDKHADIDKRVTALETIVGTLGGTRSNLLNFIISTGSAIGVVVLTGLLHLI